MVTVYHKLLRLLLLLAVGLVSFKSCVWLFDPAE